MKWRVTDSSKKNGELFVDFQIPVGAEYPPGSLHLYQQAVSAHTTCQGMPQLSSLLFSVYSCIDSVLLHLPPSQSQNINSPLHLCSIYIKRKGTADPP